MVAQRTKEQGRFARSNSAKASLRMLSPFCRIFAHSHFAAARQLSPPVKSNTPGSSYDHHHSAVGSAPCHGSNPHSQPLLLLPTL